MLAAAARLRPKAAASEALAWSELPVHSPAVAMRWYAADSEKRSKHVLIGDVLNTRTQRSSHPTAFLKTMG